MSNRESKIEYQNIILVAGDGRNVGKTVWCCKCIKYLSQFTDVIGIKITPHFHKIHQEHIIIDTDDYIVAQETSINTKDSSLMLQAGAKTVFFVMCKKDKIMEAFSFLSPIIKNNLVVIESGGLHQVVKPGIFFFVKKQNQEITKTAYLKYNPIIVNNNGIDFDFNIQSIEIRDNNLRIK